MTNVQAIEKYTQRLAARLFVTPHVIHELAWNGVESELTEAREQIINALHKHLTKGTGLNEVEEFLALTDKEIIDAYNS